MSTLTHGPRAVSLTAAVVCLVLASTPRLAAAQTCAHQAAASRVAGLLSGGDAVDAHMLAMMLEAACPEDPQASRWRVLDSLALFQLDETTRARARLAEVGDGDPEAPRARVLLAWSYAKSGDREARRAALARVPASERPRLEAFASVSEPGRFRDAIASLAPATREVVTRQFRAYHAARCKSPALAGLLSAVLPGSGQAYAGSWQGAAVSFVLSGVLIAATVELAREDMWFSASATGLAASIFYIGNIHNAVDLARRANDAASEPALRELERLLVPETVP